MIARMASVEIIGPLKQFEHTVGAIQEAGVLHLEQIPIYASETAGTLKRIELSADRARDRDMLADLAATLTDGVERIPASQLRRFAATGALAEEYARWEKRPLAEISAASRPLLVRVRGFVRRERNLADDLQVLEAYEEVIASLVPLVEAHQLPSGFQFLAVIFERRNRGAIDLLKGEIGRLAGEGYLFRHADLARGRAAVLLGFASERFQAVRQFIAKTGIAELALPAYLRNRPFEEALAVMEADLAALRAKRRALQERLERFYEENGLRLLAMHQVARDRLALYEELPKFARTDYTFIVRGWTMSGKVAELAQLLRARAGAVSLRRIRPHDMGKPPVLLQNPRAIRPFESLLALLPLPEYGSIDPTSLLAAFFPPIFGLMVADVGYGLVILIAAVLLLAFGRMRKLMPRIGAILAFCAFFTIAFGFVFGELFGSLGKGLGMHPLWRERFSLEGGDLTGAILGYLAISVGIGALQVLLGFALGIVNSLRFGERGQLASILGRMSGILAMFFLIAWLARLVPPAFASVGIAFFAAFLLFMVILARRDTVHGMILPLEVLSVLGNILSYARIMAIGMATVVLALLANYFAGLMGNIILAVVVAVIVHAVNLVLGIVDPTIQGLRLHYVEFFTKFYVSGGRRFSPFRKLGGALA